MRSTLGTSFNGQTQRPPGDAGTSNRNPTDLDNR
jgi:hypothetical protein